MNLLSHRGYWRQRVEQNTDAAFRESIARGYGFETDLRDSGGGIVIAHDPATGGEQQLAAMLQTASAEMARHMHPHLPLALNIKADGLAALMRPLLDAHGDLDCFAFDMSVPDMPSYFDIGIPVFTRMSEVEPQPAWLQRSAGVWLDGFQSEWYGRAVIEDLLNAGKRVCVVSSELHHRPHDALWELLKPLANETGLMLCTDHPEDAASYFGAKTVGGKHEN